MVEISQKFVVFSEYMNFNKFSLSARLLGDARLLDSDELKKVYLGHLYALFCVVPSC